MQSLSSLCVGALSANFLCAERGGAIALERVCCRLGYFCGIYILYVVISPAINHVMDVLWPCIDIVDVNSAIHSCNEPYTQGTGAQNNIATSLLNVQ